MFVSYAHADKLIVYPELSRISELGVRVWYDQGISAGREWPEEIAAALAGAAAVIVMITPESVASRNVRNEVNLAVSRGIPVLAVHLAQTALPPGLELQLGAIQAVMAWQMDDESYAASLARILMPYASGPQPAGGAGADAAAASQEAPAMLPPAPRWFTGRDAELAVLDGLLDSMPRSASVGSPLVAAVTGTAGAGKTALALQWAHRAASRFPGGQLYVNLRGFDPAGPASTAEAVAALLDGLGIPSGRMPGTEDAQIGLYRRLAAGRAMLIVLDNASGPAQVRPLLPPGAASLVLVTSRLAMTGLAAADGAILVPLGVLGSDKASELLAARLGPGRLVAEPRAAARIAAACAGLPLALAVTAARAAATPTISLAAVADQLAAAADGDSDPGWALDALDTGEEATSVRAVFSWSYRQLTDPAARMFRLLGLHPGPDISIAAAACLAGTPPRQARQNLSELASASLVSEQPPGRYSFHDLLRAYAAEEAADVDSEADRDAAARQVVGYYLYRSYEAAMILWPLVARYLRGPVPEPGDSVAGTITTRDGAVSWFRAEQRVLPQVLAWAARLGLDTQVLQLVRCMDTYDWLRFLPAIHTTALASAQRLGDHVALTQGQYLLGRQAGLRGQRDAAVGHYRRALEHAELAGDLDWQAEAHALLSQFDDQIGRTADAHGHALRAVELATAAGGRDAIFLSHLGWLEARAGDTEQGLAHCREALARMLVEGDPDLLMGLANLGESCRLAGNTAESISHLNKAIALARQVDGVQVETMCLRMLGDAYAAAGDKGAARVAWQQALDIYRELAPSHPEVAEIHARLGQADGTSA